MLVVPQAFIECEVRLYDKRKVHRRSPEDREMLKYVLSMIISLRYGIYTPEHKNYISMCMSFTEMPYWNGKIKWTYNTMASDQCNCATIKHCIAGYVIEKVQNKVIALYHSGTCTMSA